MKFSYLVVTTILAALLLASCEKPQLQSNSTSDDPEAKSYLELRKAAVGRRFETLTLGSQSFTDAYVLGITDSHITIRHKQGTSQIPWEEVSQTVKNEWGFNPQADLATSTPTDKSVISRAEATPDAKDDNRPVVNPDRVPEERKQETAKLTEQEKAAEIVRRQKMLEAQMAGIRQLESDLARVKLPLNEMKRRLQVVNGKPRRSGVIVERMNGDSTLVDPAREARELQAKIKVEEKLVAQLEKSLENARGEYLRLKRSIDQLLVE